VTQLLDIFAFLSVLLRGFTLAFEALTVGGVIFLLAIAGGAGQPISRDLSRYLKCFSVLLILTQIGFVGANSAILMSSADLTWTDVRGANFCIAAVFMIVGAAAIAGLAGTRAARWVLPLGGVSILFGAVMTSHSVSRLEHRAALVFLTSSHHIATAAWMGGLPYLLWSLRKASDGPAAARITSRFSRMALVAVPVLIGAGCVMALFYVGDGSAMIGTAYGLMLLSKITLTAVLVLLGALNLRIVRAARAGSHKNFLSLRRFGEVEVGIGFTIILAAASLTSTPPAVDVGADRVTGAEILERMQPVWPHMETPPLRDLSPATPLSAPIDPSTPGSFVPGQRVHPDTPADIEWSEYNHHWSGLVVLAAGLLSLLARRISWARHWPLVFLGLAAFLFLRADSENWPLGPRGFWQSFQVAEVAQHRLFVVLIIAFGIFEWAVQTVRIPPQRAGLVFPLVCAVGGALLLTHSHSLDNVKAELLVEWTHVPLAILAVWAGWSRWLELRLTSGPVRIVRWIWPVCFIAIGVILLNYREA
jgi:putative copper resistance protein D